MQLNFFSRRRKQKESLFRNFIFGVEDSLVSTVGLLSGIAVTDSSSSAIIKTGIILIFVEAFSMGIGSFLSEDNSSLSNHSRATHKRIAKGAVVMFFSYLLAGFAPLSPYFFLAPMQAIYISISLTLVSLAILGAYSSTQNHSKLWRSTLEMLTLGGLATLIGIGVGIIFNV